VGVYVLNSQKVLMLLKNALNFLQHATSCFRVFDFEVKYERDVFLTGFISYLHVLCLTFGLYPYLSLYEMQIELMPFL